MDTILHCKMLPPFQLLRPEEKIGGKGRNMLYSEAKEFRSIEAGTLPWVE
jgi:hypothetical protein